MLPTKEAIIIMRKALKRILRFNSFLMTLTMTIIKLIVATTLIIFAMMMMIANVVVLIVEM